MAEFAKDLIINSLKSKPDFEVIIIEEGVKVIVLESTVNKQFYDKFVTQYSQCSNTEDIIIGKPS
jgi:hypothetical protein